MCNSKTFQQFVGSFGHYSWVVLFAQAPIDVVSNIYSEMMNGEVDSNVTVDFTPRESLDRFSPTGAIVQITESDWTLIFHMVGNYSSFDSQCLSKKLQAKVLEFSGEDTSGQVGCRLFTPDENKTDYLIMSDHETMEEIYEYLSDVEEFVIEIPQHTIVDSYEDLFISLGIQTVKIYIGSERTVIATKNNRSKIMRVDLLKRVSMDQYFDWLEEI